MDIYDYKQKQPREPMDFRTLVTPTGSSGYYNHEFNDDTKWTAWELSNPADPDFKLTGYTAFGSSVEKELREQMELERNVVLRVRYPDKAPATDQVEIVKIMHPNWFYPRKGATPGLN
jgi:hypothetical protein